MPYTQEGVDYHYVDGRYVVGPPGGDTQGPATQPSYTTGGFDYTPAPTAGRGAFGAVPGAIGVPDPAADLSAQIPGLQGLNQQASSNILQQLRGELSPNTVAAIQDASAQWGVGSGMPGAGLSINRGLRDVGRTSEQVQQQGQQNYGALASTVANTQTASPELQAQIGMQNAINAAAPDPTVAANYSQSLFNNYMRMMNPMEVTTSEQWNAGINDTFRRSYDPLTGQTTTDRI